jgi:hypothetical protein
VQAILPQVQMEATGRHGRANAAAVDMPVASHASNYIPSLMAMRKRVQNLRLIWTIAQSGASAFVNLIMPNLAGATGFGLRYDMYLLGGVSSREQLA